MPGMQSKDQFGFPSENNALNHGKKEATKGSATPKGASFKQGPLETPISGGSFKDSSSVNPATGGGKFGSKRPSGL